MLLFRPGVDSTLAVATAVVSRGGEKGWNTSGGEIFPGNLWATSAEVTPKGSLVRESYPKWPSFSLRIYDRLPRFFLEEDMKWNGMEVSFDLKVYDDLY